MSENEGTGQTKWSLGLTRKKLAGYAPDYYFPANNKDCQFLEFDMPHIEQPLLLIILSIKVNKYKKLFSFTFVFKVMEYPQTHTQKFNLNQEKK